MRFYDSLLRLVAWFEDLAAGPVASLSFSPPAFEGAIVAHDLGQFVAPDFVVGTTEGKVRAGGCGQLLAGPAAVWPGCRRPMLVVAIAHGPVAVLGEWCMQACSAPAGGGAPRRHHGVSHSRLGLPTRCHWQVQVPPRTAR